MECPFCKEEIKDGAIKCKHCNSMLNSTSEQQQQVNYGDQSYATNIDNLNVSDIWKRRFKAFKEDGQVESSWYGYKFNSNNPILAINGRTVFSKNNYVSITAFLFTGLWYMLKGMWKKGISLIVIGTIGNIVIDQMAGKDLYLGTLIIGVIAAYSGSYDLYKYKVLKQSFWW